MLKLLATVFNRHLTKLDELNDLETMTLLKVPLIVQIMLQFCLLQGLGLNQQELEMRSILVRVQQVC